MWDCQECGCQAIAASLEACPVCLAPRPELNPVDPEVPAAPVTTVKAKDAGTEVF